MPTADDVAEWMKVQIRDNGVLYQEYAVYQIRSLFGDIFVFQNDNGNLGISKTVLSKFNKITAEDVVWCRGDKAWRKRHEYHKPGRMQS